LNPPLLHLSLLLIAIHDANNTSTNTPTQQAIMNTHYTTRMPVHPLQSHQISPPSTMEDQSYYFPSERNTSCSDRGARRPCEASSGPKAKSQSIPIQGGIRRTTSELQLCEEQDLADFRDYVMFTRIVDGICKTQQETMDYKLKQENDLCLAHIIGTRNDSDANLSDYRFPPEIPLHSSKSLQKVLTTAIEDDSYDDCLEDDGIFAIDL
jgi:hypothetical protein